MKIADTKTFLIVVQLAIASSTVINFENEGGVPDDDSLETAWKNGKIVNDTLKYVLKPGDTFIFPNKTFHLMGGIQSSNLRDIVISFEGTLVFSNEINEWPTDASGSGDVLPCLYFSNFTNVTFTSSGKATIDGQGERWWGIPLIGYLERTENRPRLFHLDSSKRILVENIILKNSPYWTFWAPNVDGLEVRFTDIDARRDHVDGHDILDLSAFNTDGFDVTGNDVWIHDCNVWCQDDTIAVKDSSTNMVFERINASGIGLTIGSIGDSVVRNITFRDCYMHHTLKGIYMKFRGGNGLITDILYENIVMDEPEGTPIWIGPAQQTDSRDLCAAHPCSLCWPILDLFAKCNAQNSTYSNITLRNVTINNPKHSPGVLLATESFPMKNITFDNVVVNNPGSKPWGDMYYKCENVQGVARGGTWPAPPCFQAA